MHNRPNPTRTSRSLHQSPGPASHSPATACAPCGGSAIPVDERAVQATASGVHVVYAPVAQPRPGEVVLEVLSTTICEADRRALAGSKAVQGPSACTVGHEAVGRVVARGCGTTLPVGQLVAVMPHVIAEAQRTHPAFADGDIYRLPETMHAGMHTHGTFAHFVRWPEEWVRPFRPSVLRQVSAVAARRHVHYTAPLAETEHLACVLTAYDHACDAERRHGAFVRRGLTQPGPRILIAGAGWMGWLWLAFLSRARPDAEIWIREPDESRLGAFLAAATDAWGRAPRVQQPFAPVSVDVAVMTTSARRAPHELLSQLRPGGHLILFSGIDGGAVDRVTDAAGLVDLERVHRRGLDVPVYRTPAADPRDRVLASGSSGYAVAAFARAASLMGRYADAICAGLSGVVFGLESVELVPLHDRAPRVLEPQGRPVLPHLLTADWRGRARHLKVVVHPHPTAEIRAAYTRTE